MGLRRRVICGRFPLETKSELAASFIVKEFGLGVETMRRSVLLTAWLAILPAIVQAQGRGAMPVMTHAPIAAPRVVTRGVAAAPVRVTGPVLGRSPAGSRIFVRNAAAHPRTAGAVGRVTRGPAVRHVTPINNNNVNLEDTEEFSEDFVPVPGLGFDIPHLAATQGRRAAGAGHRHGFGFGLSFPFFGGAVFVPVSSPVEEEAPATEEPEEVAATEPARPVRRERVQELAPTPTVEAAAAPQRETEEYVFVRRNGTLFFAVAYAWENGTLRYVTREGLWHIVSGDALDLGATQQFNEQRGLNFHLPA